MHNSAQATSSANLQLPFCISIFTPTIWTIPHCFRIHESLGKWEKYIQDQSKYNSLGYSLSGSYYTHVVPLPKLNNSIVWISVISTAKMSSKNMSSFKKRKRSEKSKTLIEHSNYIKGEKTKEKAKEAAKETEKLGHKLGLYWNDSEWLEEGCHRSNIWAS